MNDIFILRKTGSWQKIGQKQFEYLTENKMLYEGDLIIHPRNIALVSFKLECIELIKINNESEPTGLYADAKM
jgi:hypothetical protein